MQPTDTVHPALTRTQCDLLMMAVDAATKAIGAHILHQGAELHAAMQALQAARDSQPAEAKE